MRGGLIGSDTQQPSNLNLDRGGENCSGSRVDVSDTDNTDATAPEGIAPQPLEP